MEELSFVPTDGRAQVPTEAWTMLVVRGTHGQLPKLLKEIPVL